MNGKKGFAVLIVSLLFIAAFAPMAPAAENYPSREIQLVIGRPPGGSIGIGIDLIKSSLEKNLGVPVVLNHKTGGGGATGPHFMIRARPDGYTIGFFSSTSFILLPETKPNIPFKYSDLDPLGKYFASPGAVFVKGDAPWKTIDDLVADARKRPGEITYGATASSLSHLFMQGFLESAGAKMLHVPTKSAGQTITRVLGGNLDVGIVALAPLVGQIKAGSLRGILLTTSKGVKTFPAIPTVKKFGYPPPVLDLYQGFFAPLGMPKDVRETLAKAIEKTLTDPSLEKKLDEEALILDYLPPDEFAKEIKEDNERVRKFAMSQGSKK